MKQITDISGQLYVDPKRRDAFRERLERDGQIFDFQSEIRRKDGSVAWISENAHAVRDAAGELLYYEGIVDEITQRSARSTTANAATSARCCTSAACWAWRNSTNPISKRRCVRSSTPRLTRWA